MIGHQRFRLLLPWQQELSTREYMELVRHVGECEDCHSLDDLVTQNRSHLRTLQGLRPPEDLRRSVLEAAARSEEAGRVYGPLVLLFLLMPITLTILVLLAVYGRAALLGLVALLVAWATVAGLQESRRQETPQSHQAQHWSEGLWEGTRAIAVDLGGIVGGTVLLLLVTVGGCLLLQHV
jgi:hypothetical protein